MTPSLMSRRDQHHGEFCESHTQSDNEGRCPFSTTNLSVTVTAASPSSATCGSTRRWRTQSACSLPCRLKLIQILLHELVSEYAANEMGRSRLEASTCFLVVSPPFWWRYYVTACKPKEFGSYIFLITSVQTMRQSVGLVLVVYTTGNWYVYAHYAHYIDIILLL